MALFRTLYFMLRLMRNLRVCILKLVCRFLSISKLVSFVFILLSFVASPVYSDTGPSRLSGIFCYFPPSLACCSGSGFRSGFCLYLRFPFRILVYIRSLGIRSLIRFPLLLLLELTSLLRLRILLIRHRILCLIRLGLCIRLISLCFRYLFFFPSCLGPWPYLPLLRIRPPVVILCILDLQSMVPQVHVLPYSTASTYIVQ